LFTADRLNTLEEKQILPHQQCAEANKWGNILNRDPDFVAYDGTRVIVKNMEQGIHSETMVSWYTSCLLS